jgi:hypothetical protein
MAISVIVSRRVQVTVVVASMAETPGAVAEIGAAMLGDAPTPFA